MRYIHIFSGNISTLISSRYTYHWYDISYILYIILSNIQLYSRRFTLTDSVSSKNAYPEIWWFYLLIGFFIFILFPTLRNIYKIRVLTAIHVFVSKSLPWTINTLGLRFLIWFSVYFVESPNSVWIWCCNFCMAENIHIYSLSGSPNIFIFILDKLFEYFIVTQLVVIYTEVFHLFT